MITDPAGVVAAFNNGMTLYSAFLLGHSIFQALSHDRLNTLWTKEHMEVVDELEATVTVTSLYILQPSEDGATTSSVNCRKSVAGKRNLRVSENAGARKQ